MTWPPNLAWNWNAFGPLGYLGVALTLAVPLLWAVGLRRRGGPRPLLLALGLAVAALACGHLNSALHVDRLEPDRSAAEAAAREAAEAERQRKLAALGETRDQRVADIRFAEDAAGDAFDRAGLDEADLKYLAKLEGGDDAGASPSEAAAGLPEWKRAKKERTAGASGDDDLESRLDTGGEEPAGVDAADAEPEGDRRPIVVSEAEFAAAHRIDRWNVRWTRLLVAAAVVVVAADWLRRANAYAEAYLPLPLPSGLLAAVRPLPTVVTRPEPPRRSIVAELAWLLRRGDSFLYLAADPAAAEAALAGLARFERGGRRPRQILRLGAAGERCDERFVFESLWYGRCSFVADDPALAERLLRQFCRFLDERRPTRARVGQAVHLVWDLAAATPASPDDAAAFGHRWRDLIQTVADRAGRAGLSILVCRTGEDAIFAPASPPLPRAS